MCPDRKSGSLKSRAQSPSLYHGSTLLLGHVAGDHKSFQLLPFPHPWARTNSARLQRLTLHRIRYWNTGAACPSYVTDSKHRDLERHHREHTPSRSCRSTFQCIPISLHELVTHEAHQLFDVRFRQHFVINGLGSRSCRPSS